MSALDVGGEQGLPAVLGPLVKESLSVAVEGLGLAAALELRSEMRALLSPQVGRLVVVGESAERSLEAIAAVLGVPRLASTMLRLPRVHTTYRCENTARIVLTTTEGEHLVPLSEDGVADEESLLASTPGRPLQLDVSLPSAVLSWVSVVHLPNLHQSGAALDPWLSLTPTTSLAYVSSSRAPLSATEVAFLEGAMSRVLRSIVLVTGTEANPAWAEVFEVNEALLHVASSSDELISMLVLGDENAEQARDRLMGWLGATRASTGPVREMIGLISGIAASVGAAAGVEQSPVLSGAAAVAVNDAQAQAIEATQGATTWLPRLGFEFTRLRADMTERASQALVGLEQRYDQWIQRDGVAATEVLPFHLFNELQLVQASVDDELTRRLDTVAERFLGDRQRDLFPGGIRRSIAPSDVTVRLVDVSQLHLDGRTELFASLGNFGSGRQSLSLLSSVASVIAVPVALVGGVIGVGFWRLGRRSRQDNQARVQAARWLKVQTAEAGRVLRYRIDHTLNAAQLAMNLGVREHQDRQVAEARDRLQAAQAQFAEAQLSDSRHAEHLDELRWRSEQLGEQCRHLDGVLSSPKRLE